MAVALQGLQQRQHRLQGLAAEPIGGLPKRQQRLNHPGDIEAAVVPIRCSGDAITTGGDGRAFEGTLHRFAVLARDHHLLFQ